MYIIFLIGRSYCFRMVSSYLFDNFCSVFSKIYERNALKITCLLFLIVQKNQMSVTKMTGEYNLLIIFLNQDYTEEDE